MKRLSLPRVRLPRTMWVRARGFDQTVLLQFRGRDRDDRQPEPGEPGRVLQILRAAALWAIGVLIAAASGASFSESYKGLYDWATRHGLTGFWAAAFPPEIDVFIAVGELSLFIAMVDQWKKRDRAAAWAVSLAGLAASVAGNVGHITGDDLASRATAAVPPLAAFAALWVGLGTLKRVVGRTAPGTTDAGQAVEPAPAEDEQEEAQVPEVPADAESAAVIALRATTAAGNPLSGRQLESRFGLTRAQATKVRQTVLGPPEVPAIETGPAEPERKTA